MTNADLDAIRRGLQSIRAYIESPDSKSLDLEPLSKLLAASIYAHTLLAEVERLRAERAAFVRADEARVSILEQIWTVLGGPALPDDPHNDPPVSGDVEVDALELARRVVADRDRLAARVAELEAEKR